MGDTGQPPTGVGIGAPNHLNSSTGSSNMTSAWAGGAGPAGQSRKQRSFVEIITDQKKNRNILEVILTKIQTIDSACKKQTRKNLTFD